MTYEGAALAADLSWLCAVVLAVAAWKCRAEVARAVRRRTAHHDDRSPIVNAECTCGWSGAAESRSEAVRLYSEHTTARAHALAALRLETP